MTYTMKYNIYPKTSTTDTPAPIPIECEGWLRDGSTIKPLNALGQPSEFALLLIDNIAAILPEIPDRQSQHIHNPLHFQIYLKGRTEPLKIAAHIVKVVEDQIQFLWLNYDMKTSERNEQPISGVYVAVSEVIAVVPSESLPARNLP